MAKGNLNTRQPIAYLHSAGLLFAGKTVVALLSVGIVAAFLSSCSGPSEPSADGKVYTLQYRENAKFELDQKEGKVDYHLVFLCLQHL